MGIKFYIRDIGEVNFHTLSEKVVLSGIVVLSKKATSGKNSQLINSTISAWRD
ncbi:MAG: hypothetical protein R2750_04145 [Bacteroidales bacterium]